MWGKLMDLISIGGDNVDKLGIKRLIALLLIGTFCTQSVISMTTGKPIDTDFTAIVGMVTAFYFGARAAGGNNNSNSI